MQDMGSVLPRSRADRVSARRRWAVLSVMAPKRAASGCPYSTGPTGRWKNSSSALTGANRALRRTVEFVGSGTTSEVPALRLRGRPRAGWPASLEQRSQQAPGNVWTSGLALKPWRVVPRPLDSSVSQHCVRDLHESRDVRPPDVVGPALLLPVFHAPDMDALHEAFELFVDLLP